MEGWLKLKRSDAQREEGGKGGKRVAKAFYPRNVLAVTCGKKEIRAADRAEVKNGTKGRGKDAQRKKRSSLQRNRERKYVFYNTDKNSRDHPPEGGKLDGVRKKAGLEKRVKEREKFLR